MQIPFQNKKTTSPKNIGQIQLSQQKKNVISIISSLHAICRLNYFDQLLIIRRIFCPQIKKYSMNFSYLVYSAIDPFPDTLQFNNILENN